MRLGRGRLDRFARAVESESARLDACALAQLQARARTLRRDLRRHGFAEAPVAGSFALVRRLCAEVLGLRHYPAQIKGGYVLLHGGVAEMDTGEGKTLAAALPAATAALAGLAVHVVTVNDYLAQRDLDLLGPVYRAMGLSTGLVLEGMGPEEKAREYRADIVYCTNKTLVFDYLRDRVALGRRMQPLLMALDDLVRGPRRAVLLRGLQFAIVDEADSVFIDEARTPLIISAPRRDETAESFHRQALDFARALERNMDFEDDGRERRFYLNDAGRAHLAKFVAAMAEEARGLWTGEMRREEAVRQALLALHGFKRDIHYIVRSGEDGIDKVMIVDEHTGRVMPDRTWERGLQQLIELKEEVPPTPEKETLARISYQLFFRRYLHLSGMTGTCREVAEELGEVYGLPVVRIDPHRPSRRTKLPTRIFATAEARWEAVVQAIRLRAGQAQAVLVGTRSVAASEALSRRLLEAGIAHSVLNAKQDRAEAEVVAAAGVAATVTIATNMAGRGTDIKPDTRVLAAGGLHVILTERHDNARLDRQLAGRCARQGDPGSWECLLSLEDDLPCAAHPWLRRRLASMLAHAPRSTLAQAGVSLFYRHLQRRMERAQRRVRTRLLRVDFQTRRALSFSGQME